MFKGIGGVLSGALLGSVRATGKLSASKAELLGSNPGTPATTGCITASGAEAMKAHAEIIKARDVCPHDQLAKHSFPDGTSQTMCMRCGKSTEYKTISASYTLPAGYKENTSVPLTLADGTPGKIVTFFHPNRAAIVLTMPVNSKIQFEDDTESDPWVGYYQQSYQAPTLAPAKQPPVKEKPTFLPTSFYPVGPPPKNLSVFPGKIIEYKDSVGVPHIEMNAWVHPATGQDHIVISNHRLPEVVKRIPVPDKTPVVTLPTGRRFREE